ncbi:MAG: efflux RND transporter periplasmic adaptor subunit [Deltaproteobacteria bacterium]|nr:efflux RND transporter periplasmic adaptor subunit [Deltaproteobacteria bacterium]
MTFKKKIFGILFKLLMIIVPVAIGIGAFQIMSKSKKPPKQKETVIDMPSVRVMLVKSLAVVPRVLGYGTAEPIRTWKASAQVSGRIIFTHQQLQKGSIIKQGAEVLKIDPTEYRINLTKIKANIQNFKIQITQKGVEKKNYLKLLDLQKAELKFKQKEAKRQFELYKKKITSKTAYEVQLQGVISQEVQVQNIQNSLNLIPIQIELLQTQLEQAKSDLESAKLKLSYTTLTAPFDMQIAFVNNKLSEYVQAGQTILEANDISETEVEAQFVQKAMKPIFLSVKNRSGVLNAETISIGDALGISAKVRLSGSMIGEVEWKASFNRRSDTLDTETRTIGLIVSVKNKLQNDEPSRRGRLLLKGAYCEVELKGQVQKDMIVIPRSALHPGNIVLLLDSEQKLIKTPVEVLYSMSDFAVIKSGLKSGDIVILSDIVPAVNGMKVDPTVDNVSFERLVADARGDLL